MSVSDNSSLPLSGVRVLDLTTVLFGPYTTQILGDFGADVIKIEAPKGDPIRYLGPARNDGMGVLFLGANRNKRSIVLDLKRKQGRAALWRLMDGADIFVHNVRPQKIDSLGFGADEVLRRCPGIIYGGLHGYRQDGPYGGRPAYDDVIQSISGMAGLFQERDGEPKLIPSVVADKSAALMASSGLIAAYVKRLRTGQGLYMECSMFEGLVSFNLIEHQWGTVFSPPEGGPGYTRLLSEHRRPHRTRNGYLCVLPYTDKHWESFWNIAGSPETNSDPRFSTMPLRAQNIDLLYQEAGKLLCSRDTEEWLALLTEADVPVGKVNSLKDLKNDPHLSEIDFFRRYEHPTEGSIEIPDTAYQFERESLPIRRHQPQLGEHGYEILCELGMEEKEIEAVLGVKAKSFG